MDNDEILRVNGLERTYRRGEIAVPVLKDLDLEVRRGEWVACTGRSGSGKSTLLNVLGLLDRADAGTYMLAGRDVSDLDDFERARMRNELLGFVFQLHNLLPRTTALENVASPLIYRGMRRAERLRRAREALEGVGLADRADHDPSELSGGQMQRVAIARALVGNPELLLVDEPTGNLDMAATNEVLTLLDQVHAEGRTIVMITHEEDVAAHADRRLLLSDGKLPRPRRPPGLRATAARRRTRHRRHHAQPARSRSRPCDQRCRCWLEACAGRRAVARSAGGWRRPSPRRCRSASTGCRSAASRRGRPRAGRAGPWRRSLPDTRSP